MNTKIFFSVKTILFTILAMAAVSFSSCSKDNDNDEDNGFEPKEETSTYAKLNIKLTENYFEFGEYILTLEHDGISQEYKLSEGTTKKVFFRILEAAEKPATHECRVLSIPVFEYKNLPVKYSIKYELNDAGKQKIANAKEEENVNCLGRIIEFGQCTADGTFLKNESKEAATDSIPLKYMEQYLDEMSQHAGEIE